MTTNDDPRVTAAAEAVHDVECTCGYSGEHSWETINHREDARAALAAADAAAPTSVGESAIVHVADPTTGESYCGKPVTVITEAGDARPVCQACHRGAMKTARSGWCPCVSSRPQDCSPEKWPLSIRHGRGEPAAAPARTLPDRDTLARALSVADADTNGEMAARAWDNAPADHAVKRHWLRLADAVLAVLADAPTVAETRAQALDDAADAYDREAISFKPEGWGSNATDLQTINLAAWSRDWLRARAARERGEQDA